MNIKHWNAIAIMMHDASCDDRRGDPTIEDIGRKKLADGKVVHEFMIDNELYRVEKV